jgi:cytochrome c peroxidase
MKSSAQSDLIKLGKKIFFDTRLSNPEGQSCESCHSIKHAFTDPDKNIPTSEGAVKGRFGNRNTPTVSYTVFSPDFFFDKKEKDYIGGHFYDGRAANIMIQAGFPFFTPEEMNLEDRKILVEKIRTSEYAGLFKKVFGNHSLDEIEAAFLYLRIALAAYQGSDEVNPFSSKYDAYLAGITKLSESEMRGLKLFEDKKKGKCAECHITTKGKNAKGPLFTDFTYDNLGVPRETSNPFYSMPKEINPDGKNFIDIGLAKTTKRNADRGRFKVPTLRNINITAPYMHNGSMKTLKEVVDFYNTRDVKKWPAPEVAKNINKEEMGKLGLTEQEVNDIVAFMETLTDGYMK